MQHFFLGCSVPLNVIKWNHFKWKIITILDITDWVCLSKLQKIKNNILEWGETWFDQRFGHFVKKSWKETSCTIKWDGWTSVDNRPLLNILFVCPKGDYFLQAIDIGGKTESGNLHCWHNLWNNWKSGKYRCCASDD